MWNLTITETEQTPPQDNSKTEQFDEPTPVVGVLEKADKAVMPGSEYWLP